jgi:hypothetical protein
MTYNVGYTGPGLEQAPKCGGVNIYIIMWSCPGNMPKYYPGLRDILPSPYPGLRDILPG